MAGGGRIATEVAVGNIDSVDDAASTIGATASTVGATASHRATVVDTADGARQHIVGSYRNADT